MVSSEEGADEVLLVVELVVNEAERVVTGILLDFLQVRSVWYRM